jgi:hypothetical protein
VITLHISKTSVERITRDDYQQADENAEIVDFNRRLEESFDDTNVVVDGKSEFESIYLDDIDDDMNRDVLRAYSQHVNTRRPGMTVMTYMSMEGPRMTTTKML